MFILLCLREENLFSEEGTKADKITRCSAQHVMWLTAHVKSHLLWRLVSLRRNFYRLPEGGKLFQRKGQKLTNWRGSFA